MGYNENSISSLTFVVNYLVQYALPGDIITVDKCINDFKVLHTQTRSLINCFVLSWLFTPIVLTIVVDNSYI